MLAMYWQSSPISKTQYDWYSVELRDINDANVELEQLHQEEATLEQLATYSALVAGSSTPITAGLLDLSEKCHGPVKKQVYTVIHLIYHFVLQFEIYTFHVGRKNQSFKRNHRNVL